jgi:hypothetical protein
MKVRLLIFAACLLASAPATAQSLPVCGEGPAAPTRPAGLSRPRIACGQTHPEKSPETVADLPYDGSKSPAALCGPEASFRLKWQSKIVTGLPAPHPPDEGGSH